MISDRVCVCVCEHMGVYVAIEHWLLSISEEKNINDDIRSLFSKQLFCN